MRFRVCKLKDEKVVYPPQMPLIRKARMCGGAKSRPSVPVTLKKIPMSSDPVILTRRVPQGKVSPNQKLTSPPIQNRATLPNAPPTATRMYARIIKVPPGGINDHHTQELSALKTVQAVFPFGKANPIAALFFTHRTVDWQMKSPRPHCFNKENYDTPHKRPRDRRENNHLPGTEMFA